MPALQPIVSVEWLFKNLHNPDLIILDASLAKPMSNAAEPAASLKIPNSILFDIENVFSDRQNALPHMMLSEAAFTHEAQQLGIDNNSIIIVYDTIGVYSAPRAWWMFRAMGHENVHVLNGGLPAWKKAGYSCDSNYKQPTGKGNFIAACQTGLIVSQQQVAHALENYDQIVIDARSPGRFAGKAPEPRAGLRGGHMPGAINIYFEELLHNDLLLDKPALEKIFEKIGMKDQPIIFSCGSGLTACITALGATVTGYTNLGVYDGSWCEWGLPSAFPVVN
jgi:thiosulfate/3-mercaptopyruvate sulfurtransferase